MKVIVFRRTIVLCYVQPVDKEANLSYIYSAYVDSRPAPDVKSAWLPVLRVFTWFPRHGVTVTQQWRCVLWDETLRQPVDSVAVAAWTDLNKFDSSSK